MRRTSALMTVLFGLALLLTARAVAEEPKDKPIAERLIGSWKMIKEGDKPLPPGTTLTVEFMKESKMKFSFNINNVPKTSTGTWKLDGKKLTTKQNEGKEVAETVEIIKLDDKSLIFKDKDGDSVEFEKLKAEKKDK